MLVTTELAPVGLPAAGVSCTKEPAYSPDPETASEVVRASLAYAKCICESYQHLYPESKPEYFELCGGAVVFVSSTSPFTQLIGFGITEPVRPEDIALLRQYFQDRGVPLRIRVTSFTHPSLFECFAGKQFKASDFTFMMARKVSTSRPFPKIPGLDIDLIKSEATWMDAFSRGYCNGNLDPESERLGRTLFHAKGSQVIGAWVDGQVTGVGILTMFENLATLNAACTLPEYRNVGIQKALIESRMAIAAQNGIKMVMARVSPGTVSQRNFEKLGFHIGYQSMLLEEIAK